jgi:hypothetical protein
MTATVPPITTKWPADPVLSVESGLPSGQPSPGPGLGDFQIQLLSALLALTQEMRHQTEATTRLAQSNEALVKAMAEADEDDPEDMGGYTSLSQRAR